MSDSNSLPKLDRGAFSIRGLYDPDDEKSYWLQKTPQERLEALEQMRQIVGIKVQLISLGDLKQNKKASGRNKDLNDLENLP